MSGAETVVVTLLPCPLPWCGSSAVRLRYWQGNKRMHYVECECCKIKTQQSRSKERVIAAWNTRATQADALAVVQSWQGIESAPRNWDDVLVFSPEHEGFNCEGVFSAFYDTENQGWFTFFANGNMRLNPTHWMPLPASPLRGDG